MNAVVQFKAATPDLPVEVVRFEAALAKAATIRDVTHLLAMMDAAVVYAKKTHKGETDVLRQARALRLRGERRLGQMLGAMPKAKGGRPVKTGSIAEPVSTIADLGIDKKLSTRARRVAEIPDEKFEAVLVGAIPISDFLRAADPKSRVGKWRAQVHDQKAREIVEGNTPLISAMRVALRHIYESQDGEIVEREKVIAMAVRLRDGVVSLLERAGASS